MNKLKSRYKTMEKLLNCKNYFNKASFIELCELLENGEMVRVYIDCTGFTRNNNEQEIYKSELLEKYGDKLQFKINNQSPYCYSYTYSLK